jgi:hypothetical protein
MEYLNLKPLYIKIAAMKLLFASGGQGKFFKFLTVPILKQIRQQQMVWSFCFEF